MSTRSRLEPCRFHDCSFVRGLDEQTLSPIDLCTVAETHAQLSRSVLTPLASRANVRQHALARKYTRLLPLNVSYAPGTRSAKLEVHLCARFEGYTNASRFPRPHHAQASAHATLSRRKHAGRKKALLRKRVDQSIRS